MKPTRILSDNANQFNCKEWRQFPITQNIKLEFATPYNTQSDPVERVIREIGRILRTYCNEKQTNWYKFISPMEE